MNIQAEKMEVMKMIIDTNDLNIINSIKALLKTEPDVDLWETLSQNEKEDVVKGIEEVKNNDVVDYETFVSKYR